MNKTDQLTETKRELMNTKQTQKQVNFLTPYRSQTIYSGKKNAWRLLSVLRSSTATPTYQTLLEMASTLPLILEKSPIDNLLSIYPYLGISINYKEIVLTFIKLKNLNLKGKINITRMLQFLAFCDGYNSWDNMRHQLSQLSKNLVTFSFVVSDNSENLDVYTFYDDPQHPNHGQKLKTPALYLPNYDARKLWGRTNPHELQNLIKCILCYMDPSLFKNNELLFTNAKYLYKYFRDIEQLHSEILISELDITHIIEFELMREEMQKNQPIKEVSYEGYSKEDKALLIARDYMFEMHHRAFDNDELDELDI